MRPPIRSHAAALLLGVFAALVSAAVPGSAAPAGRPFRVVASDATGVTLEYTAAAVVLTPQETPFGLFQEVTIDGHGTHVEKGRPALPSAGAALAIPEGAAPRLSVQVLESRSFPGVRPLPSFEGPAVDPEALESKDGAAIDRAFYDGGAIYPSETFVYSEAGRLRHHRVGQVSVTPARFDPATGELTVVTRATIRLDFAPAPGKAGREAGRYAPVGAERAWEDTYRNTLLNYEAAKGFRMRLLPEGPSAGSRPSGSGAGVGGSGTRPPETSARLDPAGAGGSSNPEFRVFVGTTGLYQASANALAAFGWPADVPVDEIRFYEKSYNEGSPADPIVTPVPIFVEELGTPDGLFNGEDVFYAYVLNFEDRFHLPFVSASRFTHLHAYWLSWGGEGARMAEAPGWFEGGPFATPESYIHETHWEENRLYNFNDPVSQRPTPPEYPEIETHYWVGPIPPVDSLQFQTPGRVTNRPLRVRARWQGHFNGTHYVSVTLTRNCAAPSDTFLAGPLPFAQSATFTYDSGFTIPGARLADGCNRLKIRGNGAVAGDPNSPGSGAYFDWFEVDYPRRYAASGGHLRFTSGDHHGDVEFAIRGLADSAAVVFDVTDSLAPVRVSLAGARYTQVAGPPSREFELRFRAAIGAEQRTYVLWIAYETPPLTAAVAPGRMPPDLGRANIAEDTPNDVSVLPNADVIVLAHPEFQSALGPWRARREAEPYNHRVWIVSPQDVYDQFSGGNKSIPAIRTWLRHVYRNAPVPPDYLVLFGDGSEDYVDDLASSDPDWVPTMMQFGPVYTDRYELIGSDSYYVRSLGAADPESDLIPDMHLGRLSVGTPEEAQAMVAKLVAYDDYSPDETWRNRGLVVSDDHYSTSVTGNSRYQYFTSDTFEEDGDSLVASFGHFSCYTGFTAEHFRLRTYLDGPGCNLGRTNMAGDQPDLADAIACARSVATPAWIEKSSQGHLFQIYSGHGNRFVMTTERLVEYNGSSGSVAFRVPEQLTNYDKPFIFFGVACHLNEFEHYEEFSTKHALGEVMVMLPGRGAIASIASTGYEWVPTNKWVELYMGRVIFSDHPLDPVTGRPRRILGEGVDQALIRMAFEIGRGERNIYKDTLKTYFLIGDPTMRVDMAPPTLQVTVDGVPATSGGTVRAGAGSSTVTIRARLSDDVDYRADGFSILEGETVVPADRYTLTPVNDDAEGACRGAEIEYTTTLLPANYPIVLRARDWLGREMTFTLNVAIDVGYFVSGTRLNEGDLVAVGTPIEVRIDAPADIAADDIEIRVNGEVADFNITGDGRLWTATSTGMLSEGQVEIETFIRGASSGSITIHTQSQMVFNEVYFYPSPWSGGGPGQFTYQLSFPNGEAPEKVTVTIFSVSGRKVRTLDAPVLTGRNGINWDMKDSRGGELANGVYIFKVTVETASGQALSQTERLVIHR